MLKKHDFTFGKLRDEVSFDSMLYKEFIDEAVSFSDFLGSDLCRYFIDISIQENGYG